MKPTIPAISRKTALVGFFTGIFFLFLSIWYVVKTDEFIQAAGKYASELSTTNLGTRVSISGVEIDSPYSLYLHDFALYDKQGSLIAKAETIKVKFSLLSIFQNPVRSIAEADIKNLDVNFNERADRKWNYQDLFSEEESENDFRGKVMLNGASLAVSLQDGRNAALSNINGTFSFSGHPFLNLDMKANIREALLGIKGNIGLGRESAKTKLTIKGENVLVTKFLDLLPPGKMPAEIEITDGLITMTEADLSFSTDGELNAQGWAKFQNGRLKAYDYPVTELGGTVEYKKISLPGKAESGDTLALFLKGCVAGEKISAHGAIKNLSENEPHFDLAIESGGFNLSALKADLPLKGNVSFRLGLTGCPSSPNVRGEVGLNDGIIYGYSAKNVTAIGAYSSNQLHLEKLTGEIFGGKISYEGEFSFGSTTADEPKYDGHLKLADIDLSSFMAGYFAAPSLSGLDLGGRIRADLSISGKGLEPDTALKQLTLYGNINIAKASLKGYEIERVTTSFHRTPSSTVIDYLSFIWGEKYGRGELGMEGTIKNDCDLDLKFFGSHLDLALLNRLNSPSLGFSGYSDIDGTISGNINDPVIHTEFTGVKGSLFHMPFDSFAGKVAGNLSSIVFESFDMKKNGRTTWLAKGSIGLTEDKKINLRVDTIGERMENFARLAQTEPDKAPLPVTGNIDNVITITGTLDNPHIVGYMHFYRGSYAGYILNGMDGDYTIDNHVVTVQDFHIFSPRLDMDLNGTMDQKGELDIHAAIKDINLTRFENLLPYKVSGHGKFNGHITGTIEDPIFDGDLTAETLNLNGAIIEGAQGTARYAGGQLTLAPFGFRQSGGKYDVRFIFNPNTEQMYGLMNVKEADLAELLVIANAKNDYVHGRLNGCLELGGTLKNPRAALSGTIDKGDIKGQPLSNVELDATLKNRIITLNAFEGVQSNGSFSGIGTIDLDGEINLRFTAFSVDAGIIPQLADLNTTMKGTIDIDAKIGGTVSSPLAEATVMVTNGGLGASAFDRMFAEVLYSDGIIEINRAAINKKDISGSYLLTADGRIPLAALADEPGLNQIDIRVALAKADLSLLPILSDSVDWALGPMGGALHISGTLKAPKVFGQIRVTDGALKLKILDTPFTDMATNIVFTGNEMCIEECHAKLGKGNLTLTGHGALDGLEPIDYEFNFAADKLDVSSPFYRGPFSAKFNLRQAEFYGRELPKLTGNIDIHDVMISIPSLPDSEGELPHIFLDLELSLGKKVHLYSSHLYDMYLTGDVHFSGTTRQPKNHGTIKANKGSIYYLQNKFTIKQGEVHFNQLGTFMPSVDFLADTRISRTRVFLTGRGPLGNMAIKLRSSPQLSETEIMKLLTFRTTSGTASENSDALTTSLIDMGLHMSFLGELENSLRDFLNLDEFTLSSRDYAMTGNENAEAKEENEYNVQIGKYISDKVMLRYTKGFGNEINRYGIRYDFDERLSLALERDTAKKDTRIGLELRLNF